MMLRASFIIVILIFGINFISSQELVLEYEQGLGSYAMDDLKGLNEVVMEGIPLNIKLVNDFPMYWYFRPKAGIKISRFETGVEYSFQSTGSRISAKDYSGEYHFDTRVKSHSPGLYMRYLLATTGRIGFKVQVLGGIIISKLELNEFLEVYPETLIDESQNYTGQNYYVEPGLSIVYPLPKINLALNLGYNFQYGDQAFYADKNKDYVLQNMNTGDTYKPDWSGIRVGILVSYNLALKNNQPTDH